MRKLIMMILVVASMVVFTACQGDDGNSEDPNNSPNNGNETENNNDNDTNNNDNNNNSDNNDTGENNDVGNNNDSSGGDDSVNNDGEFASFEEHDELEEHIDLSLNHEIVEDNKGVRVILFKDSSQHVKYKSIYTKKDHYLKIIDTDKNDVIFRGAIKMSIPENNDGQSSDNGNSNEEASAPSKFESTDLSEYDSKLKEKISFKKNNK